MTAGQLRTLDAEVEAVVFKSEWYRIRFDDKSQSGGSFVCDRLLPPATAALYHTWGWSVKAISPEEGLVGFLAENAGEVIRGRIWETPRYSTDIAAAWEMEEEVQRQGLHFAYGLILSTMVCAVMPDNIHSYHLAHAAPGMRCRAALMTVREAIQ